ncbi:MAG: prepilin peptidase [Magnetococcales bacterium]|nr:prepilin peptidase [Magnetococcales bacterium]
MSWEILSILILYGAIVGSFLNVCIVRIPEGREIVVTPSACPRCGARIAWHDNVPILGWVWLRGRCRHCREPISIQYPLVEAAMALLAVAIAHRFGLTWGALALGVLGAALIVLTVIDLYHYILPDVITLPGILCGLGLSLVPGVGPPIADWSASLTGVIAGGGGLWAFAWSFEKITGKVGMGFGDVKLTAMIGAWLGGQALPFTIFIAAVIGSVVGLVWIVIGGRDRALPIPFGPYLAAAALLYAFYGPALHRLYMGWVLGG